MYVFEVKRDETKLGKSMTEEVDFEFKGVQSVDSADRSIDRNFTNRLIAIG